MGFEKFLYSTPEFKLYWEVVAHDQLTQFDKLFHGVYMTAKKYPNFELNKESKLIFAKFMKCSIKQIDISLKRIKLAGVQL